MRFDGQWIRSTERNANKGQGTMSLAGAGRSPQSLTAQRSAPQGALYSQLSKPQVCALTASAVNAATPHNFSPQNKPKVSASFALRRCLSRQNSPPLVRFVFSWQNKSNKKPFTTAVFSVFPVRGDIWRGCAPSFSRRRASGSRTLRGVHTHRFPPFLPPRV